MLRASAEYLAGSAADGEQAAHQSSLEAMLLSQLLAAAARRCLRAAAEVGGVVLIIDAKNDRAARWYASYGAVPLSGKPLTLVMSLASFVADLKAAGQL